MDKKISKLSKYFVETVKNELEGVQKLAICFSGSLDSALITFIAKKYTNCDVTLYTIGFMNCYDFNRANKTAKVLELANNHEYIELEKFDIRPELKEYLELSNDKDKVSMSYTLPLYILMKSIKEQYVMTGHGADTLFGGFHKYIESNNLKKDIKNNYADFIKKLPERESLIADKFEKQLILPFADKKLSEIVLEFPESYFIRDGERKYLLKLVAESIGLPKELIYQPKKAIQYSTGMIKELKKYW